MNFIYNLLSYHLLKLKIFHLGLSGKSQIMFAIVFSARYLDMFTTFVSLYNSTMKVLFLAGTFITVYLMWYKFKATNDSNHDTFRFEFLVGPCALLALVVNHEFAVLEVKHFEFCYFTITFESFSFMFLIY